MKLYSYYRSSCSYRVRIALALKGLDYDYLAVNLLDGDQASAQYREINPLGLVPALEIAPGEVIGQSLALCEWLEETHPEPPLYPTAPLERAKVRAAVTTICSEIQPLCNMGVNNYLVDQHDATKETIQQWQAHWMERGFVAVERALAESSTDFCFGTTPGMADVFLVPQVYNARRFKVSLDAYPNIQRVVDVCTNHPAFAAAAPEQQPDYRG